MIQQVGLVGLGSMGGILAQRMLEGGLEVVAFDVDAAAVDRVRDLGAQTPRRRRTSPTGRTSWCCPCRTPRSAGRSSVRRTV